MPMTRTEVASDLEACMALIPSDEHRETWLPEAAAAEDCATALAYALRCLQNGDAQEAAWAGRTLYAAADNFVIDHDRIDMNLPGSELRVLSHPLVQTELAHQLHDLR